MHQAYASRNAYLALQPTRVNAAAALRRDYVNKMQECEGSVTEREREREREGKKGKREAVKGENRQIRCAKRVHAACCCSLDSSSRDSPHERRQRSERRGTRIGERVHAVPVQKVVAGKEAKARDNRRERNSNLAAAVGRVFVSASVLFITASIAAARLGTPASSLS